MATTDRITNDRMTDKRLAQDDREQRAKTNRQALAWLVFAFAVLAILIGGYYYNSSESDRLTLQQPYAASDNDNVGTTALPREDAASGTMYDDSVSESATGTATETSGTLE